MKQIYFLITILLLTPTTFYAQTVTNVVTGLNGPIALAFNRNTLYVAESGGNKISKIDITDTTPTATDVVTGLTRPAGLTFNGNDLYVAESDGNKIYKIDITTTTPTATDVVTGLNGHYELAFNGNDLYVAEYSENKISKIDNNTISLNDFSLNKDIVIYPNPSDEFIQFSSLTENNKYSIFDILGAEIKKGVISNNEKINIRNFTNGLYFLKFDNGNTFKFIKKEGIK